MTSTSLRPGWTLVGADGTPLPIDQMPGRRALSSGRTVPYAVVSSVREPELPADTAVAGRSGHGYQDAPRRSLA